MKIFIVLFCLYSVCSADLIGFLNQILSAKGNPPKRVRSFDGLDRNERETAILDFIGLVQRHPGYTAEEYNVTTDDGYILGLHRITGSPRSPPAEGKPVAYIQHGLFGSSDFMVVLGPGNSIAFELADAGYDVWLGNARGNTYSKAHVELSPKNTSFWNFTMDNIAERDVPKFIDTVLEKTNKKKLTYIGYSMGTTLSYMLLSSKPEYNEKINLLINLAPAVYFFSPIGKMFSVTLKTITLASYWNNLYEILPHSTATYEYSKTSCSNGGLNPCTIFFSGFADTSNMNLTAIPEILAYAPGGTSYYTFEQYRQMSDANGKFRKYDYGCNIFLLSCLNNEHYNQTTPPEYDLSLVTVPNAVFYGERDIFSSEKDTLHLKSQLTNIVTFEKIPKFNHLDFVWNTKVKTLVYDRVIDLMSKIQ